MSNLHLLWPTMAICIFAACSSGQEKVDAQKAAADKEDIVFEQTENAATYLKAHIMPGEVQLQVGGTIDSDKNGIGEYGTIQQMIEQKFLKEPKLDGYSVEVHLPLSVTDREKFFVAYAYPSDGSSKAVFGICHDGEIRVSPTPGKKPNVQEFFGGNDWSAKPSWATYTRRRSRSP